MLDQIKIASPCPADWDAMEGDDRVRFCSECKKNVFNLSAMTRRDAEALLRKTNGDLCTRLYQRTDGTVLTADCPVGLRVKAMRLKRRVGWAIAGAFGLATAYAQTSSATVAGVVKDQAGSAIADARITIVNERTKAEVAVKADGTGHFRSEALNPDVYTVTATSPGFNTSKRTDVELRGEVSLDFELVVGSTGGPIFVEAVKPWWRRIF